MWSVIFHNLLICLVHLARSSEVQDETKGLPTFIREPPPIVYYPLPNDRQVDKEQTSSFDLEAVVYPSNATITIAVASSADPENYLFLPVLRTATHIDRIASTVPFRQPYAILHSSTLNQAHQNEQTLIWMARVYNLPTNAILHLLASTLYGTTRSRPVQLLQMELPGFPRYADEHLSLLIGNTGRLVCHLPRAQPSLPTVNFYHNGARLDVSDSNRYRLIYLGGDGSGIPWGKRAQSHSFSSVLPMHHDVNPNDPIFSKPMPSAAVLLIHPLRVTDSGEYRCQAQLGNKEVFAEQRTILNVTKPREKVPARLQFSSDDPEISYLYSHLIASSTSVLDGPDRLTAQPLPSTNLNNIDSNRAMENRQKSSSTPTRVFTVPEGINLTLFCTYEGAPIVSTRWFFDATNANVFQDSQFGVLTISYVTKNNEATYTCSPHSPGSEALRKSFKIQVKKRSQLVMKPGPLVTVGTGQNVSLRCGYKTEKLASSDSIQTNSPKSDVDFRHFQLGTDLGWYHNGKSIEIKQKYGKVHIEATNDATELHIINVSNYDQGMYQCWTLDNTGSWSTVASVVTMGTETKPYDGQQVIRSDKELIRERTMEGLTGHLTCNISAILRVDTLKSADLGTQPEDVVVVWYRGASDSEPIDLSGNPLGGIKYLRSTVDWASQILSVVNPRKSKDDGLYACKVYDRRTNALLGEMKFELIIESARDPLTEERSKDGTKTVLSPTQVKNDPMKIPTALGEISNIQDISTNVKSALEREFPISTPIVKRVSNFTTTIHVSWALVDQAAANQVTHFEIELRMLKVAGDVGKQRTRRRARIESPTVGLPFSIDEGYWTLPSRVANVGLQNEFCLADSKEIRPSQIYSIRVIGVVRPEDKGEFNSEIAIKSPWSDQISFENMVNMQPTITTLLAVNRTRLKLEWMVPRKSTWNLPSRLHTGSIFVHFYAITTPLVPHTNLTHPQKSLWRSCQLVRDSRTHSGGKQIFLGSWHLNGDTGDGKPFHSFIDHLESNTTYAVAIYGLLGQTEKRNMNGDVHGWYTLLSAEAIEQTPAEDMVETNLVIEESGKTSVTKDQINGDKPLAKQLDSETRITSEPESYILVVILGSLAGVLLVISLALIALCVWYHLRTKRLVYQEAVESPNKLGVTTSSLELSSTPNGYLLNAANPVLNFMDSSYQPHFTGSPQMQHLGISNHGLRQLAELQSLYQLTGCGPSQAWSTVPFNPGENARHLLHTQPPYAQPNQQTASWINTELGLCSKTKSVAVAQPYTYSQGGGCIEPTMLTHAPASNQPEVDSLLRCDSDLSEKVAHTNGVQTGSLNENNSSPGVSDTEDLDGPRIIPNDQSSSIYSHIGSESTLNELPPKILDRQGCFSPQPPPPPPIGSDLFSRSTRYGTQIANPSTFSTSNTPQIQRPIPMYLSSPDAQLRQPNPAVWNPGFMPTHMGALTANSWFHPSIVQASLLARQQSASIGQYPPPLLDSSMVPTQLSANQLSEMFYRTLPNRKVHNMRGQNVTPLGFGPSMDMRSLATCPQDQLSLTNNWSGACLANGGPIIDKRQIRLACDAKSGHEPNVIDNEHPSAQFVLKYWMNQATKPDPIRETPVTISTRETQASSKPPSSAESGRGSRPSGAGSEHSTSGERKQQDRLNQSFGDSGVDLHASVHDTEVSRPNQAKTEESTTDEIKPMEPISVTKDTSTEKIQRLESRQKKNSVGSNDETIEACVRKTNMNGLPHHKRPYSQLSSESSLNSNDHLRSDPSNQDQIVQDAETWQLREPSKRKGAVKQPVLTSEEHPTISSSI